MGWSELARLADQVGFDVNDEDGGLVFCSDSMDPPVDCAFDDPEDLDREEDEQ